MESFVPQPFSYELLNILMKEKKKILCNNEGITIMEGDSSRSLRRNLQEFRCRRTDVLIQCPKEIPKTNIDWIIIGEQIGQGAGGAVFTAEDPVTEKKYIAKMIISTTPAKLDEEICNQNLAAAQKIAPSVIDYWKCDPRSTSKELLEALSETMGAKFSENIGILIMEQAGNITMERVIERFERNFDILDKDNFVEFSLKVIRSFYLLNRAIMKLHFTSQIFHNDLHLNNIMLELNEHTVEKLSIIDYGTSDSGDKVAEKEFVEGYAHIVCLKEKQKNTQLFNLGVNLVKYLYKDYRSVEYFSDKLIKEKPKNKTRKFYKKVYKRLHNLFFESYLDMRRMIWYEQGSGMLSTLKDEYHDKFQIFFEKFIKKHAELTDLKVGDLVDDMLNN